MNNFVPSRHVCCRWTDRKLNYSKSSRYCLLILISLIDFRFSSELVQNLKTNKVQKELNKQLWFERFASQRKLPSSLLISTPRSWFEFWLVFSASCTANEQKDFIFPLSFPLIVETFPRIICMGNSWWQIEDKIYCSHKGLY